MTYIHRVRRAMSSLFRFMGTLSVVTVSTFALAQVTHAQTPCYVYQPAAASTVSVNLLTSNGVAQTITIPNQNPPSILQPMTFVANYNCALWYDLYYHPLLDANFVVPTGMIPFTGSPFSLNLPIALNNQDMNYGYLGQMDYFGLSDMGYKPSTEDALVNSIASSHQFTINAGNSGLDYGGGGWGATIAYSTAASFTSWPPYGPLTISAPATNCVALSGTGPRKIVFMRGNSTGASVSDFLAEVNNSINVLKTVEPYASSIGQFSFFADLKSANDSALPIIGYTGGGSGGIGDGITAGYIYNVDPTGNVFTSSCANTASEINVVFIKNASMFTAWTSQFGKTIFLNDLSMSSAAGSVAMPLVRQLGKSLGGLNSENVIDTSGNISTPSTLGGHTLIEHETNCSANTGQEYRAGDQLYGAVNKFQGCKFLTKNAAWPVPYYRASNVSIMSIKPAEMPLRPDGTDKSRFNVISCGYILAGINGQYPNQTNAGKFWPLCKNMNGVAGQADIPQRMPAAQINNLAPVSGIPNAYSVSGSGFTPTGNYIQLTPTTSLGANALEAMGAFINFIRSLFGVQAHAQTTSSTYEVDDIQSPDGSTLNFTIPSSVPDGTYKVTVSALNSPATATSYTITVSGNGAGDPTTAVGSGASAGSGSGSTGGTTPPPPISTALAVNGTQAVLAATPRYGCPSGYVAGGYPSASMKCTIPLTVLASCPSGLTLELTTGICYLNYNPTSIVASCPVNYVAQANPANCTAVAQSVPPVITSYTCPAGYSVSGMVCNANLVPTGLRLSAAPGQVTWGWNNNAVLNIANILLTSTVKGTTNLVATLDPTSTSYMDTTVPTGISYTASLQLLFTNGQKSTPVTATITTSPPVAAPVLTATTTLAASISSYVCPVGYVEITTYTTKFGSSQQIPNTNNCGNTSGAVVAKIAVYSCPTSYSLRADHSCILTQDVPGTAAVRLLWTEKDAGVTSYLVVLSSQSQSQPLASSTVTAYTIGGLSAGTTYCYQVYAYVNADNISPLSNIACATPIAVVAPAVNTSLSAPSLKVSSKTTTSLTLSWTDSASGITKFNVSASPSAGVIASPTAFTYTITNLLPGTAYCYTVSAYANASTISRPSNIACGTTISLVAPTNLSAQASTQGQVNLSWSNNGGTDINLVSVERSTSKTSGFTRVGSTQGTTFVDTGLAPATAYYYAVRFLYSDGYYSGYSATTTVTTKRPTTPSLSAVASSSSIINLSWNDSDIGVTSYIVMQTVPVSASIASGTVSKKYAVTGLLPNTKYCFTVSAYINNQNSSAPSSTVCATTKAGSSVSTSVTTSVPATTTSTTTNVSTSLSPTSIDPVIEPTPVVTSVISNATALDPVSAATTAIVPAPTVKSAPVVTISATATVTCPANYKLYVLHSGDICGYGFKTTPPTTVYSCPSGYILNTSAKTCSSQSSKGGAYWWTASVIDAF